MMRLVHLLGNETTYRVSVLECVEENLVAPLIEFLDLLALHIGLAGVPELASETGGCELPRDPLGDQLDALHYQREVRDRNRSPALGHDVTCESNPAGHLISCWFSPAKAFARCDRRPRSSGPLQAVPTSRPRRLEDPSATVPMHPGSVARTSTLLRLCRAA